LKLLSTVFIPLKFCRCVIILTCVKSDEQFHRFDLIVPSTSVTETLLVGLMSPCSFIFRDVCENFREIMSSVFEITTSHEQYLNTEE